MSKVRKLGDPTPKKNLGPKNAPAPKIPKPKVNKHGSAAKQPAKPEMHPQQLNPLEKKEGQPQYKDERIPGSNLRALVAHLRNS